MTTVAYKNARQAIGTSYATVYTCPSGTTALVMVVAVSNVDGTNAATVDSQYLDSSASNVATRASPVGLSVGAQVGINILAGPLTLEAGDAFQLKASDSSRLEAWLSIREES